MSGYTPDDREIDALYGLLHHEAEASGYHLNPDAGFTKSLVRGLLINEKRYGYRSCPCRLADGDKNSDLDIICPCDYRDIDLDEHDTCYCKLYVSQDVLEGKKQLRSIPERRPVEEERRVIQPAISTPAGSAMPVWRCRVCGYLCARGKPPPVCPICKAKKERFERFPLAASSCRK